MGETRYKTNNGNQIQFEIDDETYCGCLCTFPHNNEVMGNKLSPGTVASLALLGAGIAIAANKPSSMIDCNSYDGQYYIPSSIPQWVRDEIDRILNL